MTTNRMGSGLPAARCGMWHSEECVCRWEQYIACSATSTVEEPAPLHDAKRTPLCEHAPTANQDTLGSKRTHAE
jgi:hypothetical protein